MGLINSFSHDILIHLINNTSSITKAALTHGLSDYEGSNLDEQMLRKTLSQLANTTLSNEG